MSIPWMKRILELGGRSEDDGATAADANDCMGPHKQTEENETKIGEGLTKIDEVSQNHVDDLKLKIC